MMLISFTNRVSVYTCDATTVFTLLSGSNFLNLSYHDLNLAPKLSYHNLKVKFQGKFNQVKTQDNTHKASVVSVKWSQLPYTLNRLASHWRHVSVAAIKTQNTHTHTPCFYYDVNAVLCLGLNLL